VGVPCSLTSGLTISTRAARTRPRRAKFWERFPKFIIGYLLTFAVVLLLTWGASPELVGPNQVGRGSGQRVPRDLLRADVLLDRRASSNFRKLWQEGIGKLVAVYALSLFGFIIWVGLLISWIFFRRRQAAAGDHLTRSREP